MALPWAWVMVFVSLWAACEWNKLRHVPTHSGTVTLHCVAAPCLSHALPALVKGFLSQPQIYPSIYLGSRELPLEWEQEEEGPKENVFWAPVLPSSLTWNTGVPTLEDSQADGPWEAQEQEFQFLSGNGSTAFPVLYGAAFVLSISSDVCDV